MKKIILVALVLITGSVCFGQHYLPINIPREDGYSPEWVASFAGVSKNTAFFPRSQQSNPLAVSYRNYTVSVINKRLAEGGVIERVSENNLYYIFTDPIYSRDTIMYLPAGYINSGRPKNNPNTVEPVVSKIEYYGPVRICEIYGCFFALYKEGCTNTLDYPILRIGTIVQIDPIIPTTTTSTVYVIDPIHQVTYTCLLYTSPSPRDS